jgi:hypothetical protein
VREMMGIDHDLLKTGACQEFPRIMDQRTIQERNGRLGAAFPNPLPESSLS